MDTTTIIIVASGAVAAVGAVMGAIYQAGNDVAFEVRACGSKLDEIRFEIEQAAQKLGMIETEVSNIRSAQSSGDAYDDI
jgi:hypothetical protein